MGGNMELLQKEFGGGQQSEKNIQHRKKFFRGTGKSKYREDQKGGP